MNQSHKRKRGKPAQVLETPEQRATKCLSKYHHANIEATRCLKKVLALELQKIKKRLKKAQETQDDDAQSIQSRLTEELDVAKSLETDEIARYYLSFTIHKSHTQLAELLSLTGTITAPHKDASDATKNVVARLLGSKTFKEFIKTSIEQLEVIADIVQPPKKTLPQAQNHGLKEKQTEAAKDKAELPFTNFDTNGDDDDDDESDDEQESEQERVIARDQRCRDVARTEPTSTSSTFLPSLQSGYLPAENSSDDEQELQGLFPAQKKERKNRRGQRARRRILEAKHGNKANHIVKERETRQKEFEERVARRAAREAAKTGANAIAIEEAEKNRRERREQALRPIHGSWQIAKAQKEKMKAAKPEGVKISFD